MNGCYFDQNSFEKVVSLLVSLVFEEGYMLLMLSINEKLAFEIIFR